MKALEPHLYSRNGHFYYRSAIPRNLQRLVEIKEITISLRVHDLREARLRAAQLNYAEQKILSTLQKHLLTTEPAPQLEPTVQATIKALESLKRTEAPRMPHSFKTPQESKKGRERASPLFSEIAQKYLAECLTDAPRTKQQKESTLKLFMSVQGDKPFQKITQADLQAFKTSLLNTPTHAKNRLKGEWTDTGKALNYKTINGRLGVLRTIFHWAKRNGLYEGNNPASGLMLRAQKGSSNRRATFKTEEIQSLFSSPLYTGCQGREWSNRLSKGNKIIKDALYWVPLIGLYSGMRLNEICQLELNDIRQEEEIWVFDINDSGTKTLKTTSSARLVPIHQKLIEDGIIEYCDTLKNQNEIRLFPDLKEGVNNSLSAPFSKRFRRLLDALDITREGICFHSFRHTFIDGLRKAGVERSIAMALAGHQSSDVHDQYGNGYDLESLEKVINKLIF